MLIVQVLFTEMYMELITIRKLKWQYRRKQQYRHGRHLNVNYLLSFSYFEKSPLAIWEHSFL